MTSKIRFLLMSCIFIACMPVSSGECAENVRKKGEPVTREQPRGEIGKSQNGKAPDKGSKNGWLVSQNSPVNPYASSQSATLYGGIADLRAGPFEVIVDADNQTITIVSHKSRLFYQGPFSEWKKRYYPESIRTGRKFLVDSKATRKQFGITAHQSFFSQKESDGSHRKLREVWWTDDIKVSGVGGEYVWICAGLPVHAGLPLSITRLLPDGKKDPILSTVSVKKSNVVLSSFKPLPDYKKVRSEFELQVGKSEDLDELLGGE